MPCLELFDPRPAINHWLETKNRRVNERTKAKSQPGVFKDANQPSDETSEIKKDV
jgi:hypothetical protein